MHRLLNTLEANAQTTYFGLPVWLWIAIGVVVLALIFVIAARGRRRRQTVIKTRLG